MPTWSEAIEAWILDPDSIEAFPTEAWAFVVVRFIWNPNHAAQGHAGWLISNQIRKARIHQIFESITPDCQLQQTHQTLSCLVPNPQDALTIALLVLNELGHHVRITTGMGAGHYFDTFMAPEYLTCHHLLPFVQPHELVMLQEMKASVNLPHGVGAFPASNAAQKQTGCSYWIIKDYR